MKTAYSTEFGHLQGRELQLVTLTPERMGRFGEAVCEHVMKASGVYYIPLCDIKGRGAPMAIAATEKVVLPDFDVAAGSVHAYLDAKVKTQSVRYRKTGQLRHGIDRSKYEAYQAMGVLQDKQCGLFLVELLDDVKNWSGTILSESFRGLGEPLGGFSNQNHMVYWPRARFGNIGSYSADELAEIANGHLAVDMSALLQTAFAAPPPHCPNGCPPELWIDEPERDSRGWIRTVCRKCNKWQGNRPPELA